MSIAQFWYAFFNGFSGQKYYTEGGIQLFNLLFTNIPILLLSIYDTDINYSVSEGTSSHARPYPAKDSLAYMPMPLFVMTDDRSL
jgi:magnesium-transporting ATPase (P-type)